MKPDAGPATVRVPWLLEHGWWLLALVALLLAWACQRPGPVEERPLTVLTERGQTVTQLAERYAPGVSRARFRRRFHQLNPSWRSDVPGRGGEQVLVPDYVWVPAGR